MKPYLSMLFNAYYKDGIELGARYSRTMAERSQAKVVILISKPRSKTGNTGRIGRAPCLGKKVA